MEGAAHAASDGQSEQPGQHQQPAQSGSGGNTSSDSDRDGLSDAAEARPQVTPQATQPQQPQQPQPQRPPSPSRQPNQNQAPLQNASQSQTQPPQKPAPGTAARYKALKHVVGGGASTSRLHARAQSSKALHKQPHHGHAASTTKLAQQQQQLQLQQLQQLQQQQHRRQLSYSPPAQDLASPLAPTHRRSTSTSEVKLNRHTPQSPSSASLRKNVSASSLQCNRTHADVPVPTKRTSHSSSRPSLKRTASHPAGNDKQRAHAKKKNTISFEIGSPDILDQDDEWVDAGSSTANSAPKPRRDPKKCTAVPRKEARDSTETVESTGNAGNTGNKSSEQTDSSRNSGTKKRQEPDRVPRTDRQPEAEQQIAQPPPAQPDSRNLITIHPTEAAEEQAKEPERPSSSASVSAQLKTSSSTTRILLPRTPSRGAPPKMSTETVIATGHPLSASPSSDSSHSQQPQPAQQTQQPQQSQQSQQTQQTQLPHQNSLPTGSSGRDVMTSRFITTGSHESVSGTTNNGSFYTSSSRPGTSRRGDERELASSATTASTVYRQPRPMGGDANGGTDDEESGIMVAGAAGRPAAAGAAGTNPRRTRPAPPAELSRTQQKLNLERASSSLDRSNRQHQGPAAGPLLGAGGFGIHDPRIAKMMEKTRMEYYVVRRYQNPVTRSLERLHERRGSDKGRRIPSDVGGARSLAEAAAAGAASLAGLSQSFRERELRHDVLQQSGAAPPSLARTRTLPTAGTATDDARHRPHYPSAQRLSGASLVDGDDANDTAALLRNLWEKSTELGTSQD